MSKIADEPSMSDLFAVLDADKKIRKEGRLQRASDLIGWTKHTQYHWSRVVNGERLNWWPTTNKWSYGIKNGRAKMHHGNQEQLLAFIAKEDKPSTIPDWVTEPIDYES